MQIDRINFDYSLEHYVRCMDHMDSLQHDLTVVTSFYVENYIYEHIAKLEDLIKYGFARYRCTFVPEGIKQEWIPCTYIDMLENAEDIKQHNLKAMGFLVEENENDTNF